MAVTRGKSHEDEERRCCCKLCQLYLLRIETDTVKKAEEL